MQLRSCATPDFVSCFCAPLGDVGRRPVRGGPRSGGMPERNGEWSVAVLESGAIGEGAQ